MKMTFFLLVYFAIQLTEVGLGIQVYYNILQLSLTAVINCFDHCQLTKQFP